MKPRRLLCIALIILLFLTAGSAAAVNDHSGAYDTYNYSYADNSELRSAAAYVPAGVIRAGDMGLDSFNTLSDIFIVEATGDVWLADTGNNRIIRTTLAFEDAQVFSLAGGTAFSKPRGVYVRGQEVYVADTGNKRVIRMNTDGQTLQVYGKPDSPQFSAGVDFKPQKVVVNTQGEINIICEGIYEGMVTIGRNGAFEGYSGTIPVRPSIWQLFWRVFSTREQLKSMSSFLPVTYINADMDENEFVFATSQADQSAMTNSVQRLNPGGNDVLINNSGQNLIGDLGNRYTGRAVGASVLNDVCCMEGGLFACTDQRRSKIFLYNSEGQMLFAFGGAGSQNGNIAVPSAIDNYGFDLYVVDSSRGQITRYTPTVYGKSLIRGILLYNSGAYEESNQAFLEAFRYNTNSELAYLGIGKVQLRNGLYQDAMVSFRLASNRAYYSKALKQYRQQVFDEHFALIFTLIIVVLALAVLMPFIRKRRKGRGGENRPAKHTGRFAGWLDKTARSVDYAFYCALHPFKGFYALKHEREGTMAGATVLLALFVVVSVVSNTLTGFIFSGNQKQSPFLTAAIVCFPVALFVVANWCITTLMSGEGRMRDIYMAAWYALMPMILGKLVLMALSNVLILEESSIYTVIEGILWAYTVFLLLVGNMSAHGFTMGRTVRAAMVTAIAMAVIVFLFYLFVNLLFEVGGFALQIYREIAFRA